MEKEVKLVKEAYGRITYSKVIDTSFTELITPPITEPDVTLLTVEQFFDAYNELFFQIPATGEVNSHEYLVARSTEYLGGGALTDNEKAYIEEINSLRQQLLEANTNVITLRNIV